jgi:hypothetical protein
MLRLFELSQTLLECKKMVDEELFPLAKAPIPGRPSIPTLWRWRQKGVRGVRLETITVGGRTYVSRAAIEKFIAGTTTAASGEPAPLRSPAARERAIARAEKELADAGI